jgi:hypothetical protein
VCRERIRLTSWDCVKLTEWVIEIEKETIILGKECMKETDGRYLNGSVSVTERVRVRES